MRAGRLHILETRHGLSVLSSRVLLPCVLFTEALTSAIQQPGDDAAVVGFAVVRHLWLVLLTPIVYATLGLIVGWLLTTFVPMPPEHRRLCLSMVAVGSSTGWPIVLLSAFIASSAARAPNVNGVTPLLCVCVRAHGGRRPARDALPRQRPDEDEPLASRRRPAAAQVCASWPT